MTASAPVAFITLGGAGSGKTTLSKHLSVLTDAVYLDKDAMSAPLVQFALEALGHDPTDRESNDTYVSSIMPLEYEVLFAVAAENLALGHSVVLDAPFVAYLADPSFLERSAQAAGWPPVEIRVIHVRSDPAVVKQRLRNRGLERDRVKLADWDAYWRRFGALTCAWTGASHHEIRNDDDQRALEDLANLVAKGWSPRSLDTNR